MEATPSATRELEIAALSGRILSQAQVGSDEGIGVFWLSQFTTDESEENVAHALGLLESQGLIAVTLGFRCPQCEREWQGNKAAFSALRGRCPPCGSDLSEHPMNYTFTFELSQKKKGEGPDAD